MLTSGGAAALSPAPRAARDGPGASAGFLSRSDFGVLQVQQRFASRAHKPSRFIRVGDGKDPRLMASRTRSGGGAGVGVGRCLEILRSLSQPGRFQFECRVTAVANVVVATLRLAGIKHVRGAAMRAGQGNRCQGHWATSMRQQRRWCQGERHLALLWRRKAGSRSAGPPQPRGGRVTLQLEHQERLARFQPHDFLVES